MDAPKCRLCQKLHWRGCETITARPFLRPALDAAAAKAKPVVEKALRDALKRAVNKAMWKQEAKKKRAEFAKARKKKVAKKK